MSIAEHYKTEDVGDPLIVPFSDFQEFGRGIADEDQASSEGFIRSAVYVFESQSNVLLYERNITASYDITGVCSGSVSPFVTIRRSPLLSVSEVLINDSPSESFTIQERNFFSRILLDELSLYSLDSDVPYPVKVTFKAGLVSVPDDIQTAIKQLALFLYENRGEVNTDCGLRLPLPVKMIIDKYRIFPG